MELREKGHRVGRQRLRTAMRARGLRALRLRAFTPRTTDSTHGLHCAPTACSTSRPRPARRVFADDALSYNPFHCLPDHRPLGFINRARLKAYEASSAFRHHMNAQPRLEPHDISQLPD